MNNSPSTYIEIASLFENEESVYSYFCEIKDKINSLDFSGSNLMPNKEFGDMLRIEINRSPATHHEIIFNILKLLDNYRLETNEKIKILVQSKNINSVLQLYYEKQKLASMFLKQPHRMLFSGRAAITDCLFVKYGNISYGSSRHDVFGTYL